MCPATRTVVDSAWGLSHSFTLSKSLSVSLSLLHSLSLPPSLHWLCTPQAFFSSIFLLCLVTCTSKHHSLAHMLSWIDEGFLFYFILLFYCPIWGEDILSPWTKSPKQTPYCLLHCCKVVVTHVHLHGEDRSDWLARDPLVYFWIRACVCCSVMSKRHNTCPSPLQLWSLSFISVPAWYSLVIVNI